MASALTLAAGMQARQTNIKERSLKARHRKHGSILKAVLETLLVDVPNGNGPAGSHRAPQAWDHALADPFFAELVDNAPDTLKKAWERGAYQLGSLGGGNHFLEVQADEDSYVWVMLHSGSRDLGKAVCDHFTAIARELNQRFHSEVPDAWQLAFLPSIQMMGEITWPGCDSACTTQRRTGAGHAGRRH